MCPINFQKSGDDAQICFINYDELSGVPRGQIFGLNARSMNRWKYMGGEATRPVNQYPEAVVPWEEFLGEPFDYLGMTNHQLVFQDTQDCNPSRDPTSCPSPCCSTGAMRCKPGTIPIWRGCSRVRAQNGELQPVSIYQCVNPRSPMNYVRNQQYQYA